MVARAVLQMSNLIRQLYHSWHFECEEFAAECETVVILFAEHVSPRSKSTYLFMQQHDFPVIPKGIYPWGLGMFCQDICENWNCILKKFYNHHTTRGGGCGLTIKRGGRVLTRVLQCESVHSHSHIVANGFQLRGGCTNARLYAEWDLTIDIIDSVMMSTCQQHKQTVQIGHRQTNLDLSCHTKPWI